MQIPPPPYGTTHQFAAVERVIITLDDIQKFGKPAFHLGELSPVEIQASEAKPPSQLDLFGQPANGLTPQKKGKRSHAG